MLQLKGILLYLLFSTSYAESRQTRTPARTLAKQTGASQFEEERYETHADCNDHKHILKKRASDEDIDYEVYQGVVGRPGIDFPILPRIPKTSFSCRSFGNGYFADMDTDCQVFHICEEGRKISFLCPNGTIFQQSELTCDWWFKVNCLGSPGYYAESAEILNKQRVLRVRPSVPVKGFNIVGGSLNIKPQHSNAQPRSRYPVKSVRRIDSSEQQSLVEAIDFEDISGEKVKTQKSRKGFSNIDNISEENESQKASETASFVSGRNKNTNAFDKPSQTGGENHNLKHNLGHKGKENSFINNQKIGNKNNFNEPITNTQSPERRQNNLRGHEGLKEDKKVVAEIKEKNKSEDIDIVHDKSISPSSRSQHQTEEISPEQDAKPEFYNKPYRSTEKAQQSEYHSTARKLENTRRTPFYTPTVPSVSKTKITDSKSFYGKNKGVGKTPATTLSPNQINGDDIFTESSKVPRSFDGNGYNKEVRLSTTLRPNVIGMRHYQDGDTNSREIHRFSMDSKNPLEANVLQITNVKTKQNHDSISATTPALTGPTYLPKSGLLPKNKADTAGSDLQVFAPNTALDESVGRNVDEMLATMSFLKNKLESGDEVEVTGPARSGLDIPPSSGPDVLITLAKYFAAEQSVSNASSLNDVKKSTHRGRQGNETHNTVSRTTAASTASTATPNSAFKRDDIKSSLLSERTVDRYTSLFGLNEDTQRKSSADTSSHKENAHSLLKDTHAPFPQIGPTHSTTRELAKNPESRKLAKIFSNGLSKYLEDPTNFRQELRAIRPTKPRSDAFGGITPNFTPTIIKDKALFRSGTAATYLPTRPTSPANIRTMPSNIASEVNNKFDFTTQLPGPTITTELVNSTKFKAAKEISNQRHELELSAELSPPNPESDEGEELLNREQTQSFVKPRYGLSSGHLTEKRGKASGAYISAAKPTENPWNGISQTSFLDPLTINDGLMKESKSTTANPYTYSPKDLTLHRVKSKARSGSSRYELSSAEVTTQQNAFSSKKETESWDDILRSYDLPLDTLPSSNGLQRIANRLFGGLNEIEALHLKNVMQQAEHNRQVLRLLLLLIQTCDDQNGKALERSRKHLLTALIDMDSKLNSNEKSKSSHQNTIGAFITTESPFGHTKSRDDIDTSTFSYPSTTTDFPAMTTTTSGSLEETTKFEIHVEDPDSDQISTSSTISATNSNTSSDRRALELLKSLYSLASKFASRR